MAIACSTFPLMAAPQALAELDRHQFGVVCIQNPTNVDINYQYKWGDRKYKTVTVKAGSNRWHSWKYSSNKKYVSPNFKVTFDYDLSPHKKSYKSYSLKRYRNKYQGCDGARKYKFAKEGDCIDLYSVKD